MDERWRETLRERIDRGYREEGTQGTCDTCGNDQGIHRMDNGLPVGCHCDPCWDKIVLERRSR